MTTPAWIPDNSAIQAFRENPEMFRLKYRLHLAPATPDDKMRAGSAIHAGRNVLFSGGSVEDAVRAARAIRGEGEGARNAEHVERIVRAYAARYPREAEPFEVVCNEEYVEASIHDPQCADKSTWHAGSATDCTCFDFCGIIDSVVRFPDGSEYVMDLKTTGAYLNDQWQTMCGLNDQFVGYVALRRALGHRCDGFFVDGVHVNDYVRKGATAPTVDAEKDFARYGPIRVPEWRIERWVRNMQYTLAQIAWLDTHYGPDVAWPLYQNWAYGKVDAYREFYETPDELHASVAQQFERREWSPREVAEERANA